MIFSICNHHHIATELGSGCMPQSNTFHVPHTDNLVVTLLPCSQNQILPHLLLMLQNMCSAWFLFSPNSLFPGQEQPGLKIHVSEKKAPHRKSSKVCFPRGFLQAESSLQHCKSYLQAELEESKDHILASPVTKSCCALQTRRKLHWQCTETQGISWTEIPICVPNETPLELTGPKPSISPCSNSSVLKWLFVWEIAMPS